MDTNAFERAWTTEGAISILKTLLSRPHPRGNGKSTMTGVIYAALCRALIALEKESERGNTEDKLCSGNPNTNVIFVDLDVYCKIKNNPNSIIINAKGEPSIELKVKGWKRKR